MNMINLIGRKLVPLDGSESNRRAVAGYLKRVFVNMQKFLEPDISLEIGAHEASYSRELRPLLPAAVPVLAFEASPNTHRHFAKELALLFDGIQYRNLAFAEKSGRISFFEYLDANRACDTAAGFSSIYERDEKFYQGAVEKVKVEVEAISGDDFFAASYPDKKAAALWVDVEGAQAEVLAGLEKSFADGRIASVFIEVEYAAMWPGQKMLVTDVVNFLHERGLNPFLRDSEWGIQFNMIFVRIDLMQKYRVNFADLAAKYVECIDNLMPSA